MEELFKELPEGPLRGWLVAHGLKNAAEHAAGLAGALAAIGLSLFVALGKGSHSLWNWTRRRRELGDLHPYFTAEEVQHTHQSLSLRRPVLDGGRLGGRWRQTP
jgi:hypothetical protein